jgi:hypothetical protein
MVTCCQTSATVSKLAKLVIRMGSLFANKKSRISGHLPGLVDHRQFDVWCLRSTGCNHISSASIGGFHGNFKVNISVLKSRSVCYSVDEALGKCIAFSAEIS